MAFAYLRRRIAYKMLQRIRLLMDGQQRLRTDTSADMLTNSPKNREGGRFVLLRRRGSHSKMASDESATKSQDARTKVVGRCD